MKRVYSALMLLLVGLLTLGLSSCDTKELKSLTEMLKEEETAIANFITQEHITVKDYAQGQTTFDSEVYYKFNNGLYMQVLDRGGELPIADKTRVNVRFKGRLFNHEGDKGSFDNLSTPGYQDTEFIYIDKYSRGALHFILVKSAPGYSLNALMCEGLAFPMSLLGNGAKVRLIIPFSIGVEANYRTGHTMFCEEVHYEFTRQ